MNLYNISKKCRGFLSVSGHFIDKQGTKCKGKHLTFSPIKVKFNVKQIATQAFFTFLVCYKHHIKQVKTLKNSNHGKPVKKQFKFCICFEFLYGSSCTPYTEFYTVTGV
jgi:hypothetical protein